MNPLDETPIERFAELLEILKPAIIHPASSVRKLALQILKQHEQALTFNGIVRQFNLKTYKFQLFRKELYSIFCLPSKKSRFCLRIFDNVPLYCDKSDMDQLDSICQLSYLKSWRRFVKLFNSITKHQF